MSVFLPFDPYFHLPAAYISIRRSHADLRWTCLKQTSLAFPLGFLLLNLSSPIPGDLLTCYFAALDQNAAPSHSLTPPTNPRLRPSPSTPQTLPHLYNQPSHSWPIAFSRTSSALQRLPSCSGSSSGSSQASTLSPWPSSQPPPVRGSPREWTPRF